jgi:protein-tyrosine-phosphatase
MAEALLRAEGIDRIRVASAGSEPSRVHPLAVRAMAERGIDIGQQVSKSMDEPARLPWDLVITVCDRVREVCPAFPSQTTLSHWSIRDPAAATGSEPVQLEVFRQTAADLARRVRYLALTIDEGGARWNT